ncbi:MAG TPA: hypothetical protein VGD59_10020 [Acidisarcina sp.]
MFKRLSFLQPESATPQFQRPILDDGDGRRPPPNNPGYDSDATDAIGNDATTDAADYDGPWNDGTDNDAFSFLPDSTGADGTIDSDCSDSCDSCDSCCSCGEGFTENPRPCSCSCGGCSCGGCDSYYE